MAGKDLDRAVAEAHERYRQANPASGAADARARQVLPGGNTRSVLEFAPFPFRFRAASGAEFVDLDGQRYIDFCGNYTARLLGHSPTGVERAIVEALEQAGRSAPPMSARPSSPS